MDFLKIITNISTDTILLLAAVTFFFLVALRFGKERLIALILAFYPALLLLQVFPYRIQLREALGDSLFWADTIVFLVLLILISIPIFRLASWGSLHSGLSGAVKSLLLSLGIVGLLLVFFHQFVLIEALYSFSPTISNIVSSPSYLFWWFLAPLAVVFVATRE